MSAGTFVGGEPGSSAGTPGDMNGSILGTPRSSSGVPENQSLLSFLAMLDRKADCGHGVGSGVGWWTPERKNMVLSLPAKAGMQVACAWEAQADKEQPDMWLPLLELLCRVSWKALATTLWLKIRGPLEPMKSFWDQNFDLEDARTRYAEYYAELKVSLEQKARLLGGPGSQWAKGLAESVDPEEVVYPGGQVGAPAPEPTQP